MRAFKYGTVREWVLGLEVVLPTGEVIKTGALTSKSVTGLDLTRLFIGSEGTLGIITKAILKLRPLPEAIVRLSAFFDRIEDVVTAVRKMIEAGIMPLMMEFLDRDIIRMVNDWLKLDLPEAEAMMIIDLDGTKEQIERLSKEVEKILEEARASNFRRAATAEEMASLYLARKAAYPSIFRLGKGSMMGDICVPISKLPDAFRLVKEIAKKHGVYVAIFGHVGDGNLHPLFSVDLRDPKEVEKVLKCYDEIMRAALQLGGSVTAEHGIGISKLRLLEEECGTEAVKVMKTIKRALDPNNIMNPGKWI
jgi:glycolate oxidase